MRSPEVILKQKSSKRGSLAIAKSIRNFKHKQQQKQMKKIKSSKKDLDKELPQLQQLRLEDLEQVAGGDIGPEMCPECVANN